MKRFVGLLVLPLMLLSQSAVGAGTNANGSEQAEGRNPRCETAADRAPAGSAWVCAPDGTLTYEEDGEQQTQPYDESDGEESSSFQADTTCSSTGQCWYVETEYYGRTDITFWYGYGGSKVGEVKFHKRVSLNGRSYRLRTAFNELTGNDISLDATQVCHEIQFGNPSCGSHFWDAGYGDGAESPLYQGNYLSDDGDYYVATHAEWSDAAYPGVSWNAPSFRSTEFECRSGEIQCDNMRSGG